VLLGKLNRMAVDSKDIVFGDDYIARFDSATNTYHGIDGAIYDQVDLIQVNYVYNQALGWGNSNLLKSNEKIRTRNKPINWYQGEYCQYPTAMN
jgi:hypothetical protein